MKRSTRRWAILGAAAALACIATGGVIAAQFTNGGDPERLAAAIDEDPFVLVADIPAAGAASRHSVFVQKTSTGHVCIWDTPFGDTRRRQGGCNSADDPLAGRPLSVSFAYDGGPSVASVRDARLIGLGATSVAAVEVLMSDGTRRSMPLRTVRVGMDEFRAFGYRFKRGDLRRSVAPVAVVAFDAAGQEIDRQATGFAG